MTYDSPAEDVRPTKFLLPISVSKSSWLTQVSIAITALFVAMIFGGAAAVLKASPPQSNGSVASRDASKNNKQPIKSSAQHVAAPITQPSPNDESSSAVPYRAVLNQYCVVCHNEQLRTAGLVLRKMDVANVPQGAEVWEKVIGKLRTGAMLPAGMPRPDNATYDTFATYLETALDHAAVAKPNPGRVAVHRLNRAEYTNAIRDFLAMDVDVASLLPVDDSGYSFDNIADVLSISPMLLVRYMSAAGKVTRLAIGDPNVLPNLETYDVPYLLTQDERMSEDLPFGSRGGIAIRHNFPLDAVTYV